MIAVAVTVLSYRVRLMSAVNMRTVVYIGTITNANDNLGEA